MFANLVFEGKIHSVIRHLTNNYRGGVLSLDKLAEKDGRTVRQVPHGKHLPERDISAEALIELKQLPFHMVMFEEITGSSIRAAALQKNGTVRPSGIDVVGWRKRCCSLYRESRDLCNAIVPFTRRICTSFVDPDGLNAFFSLCL